MKEGRKLIIAADVDDVLCPCVAPALEEMRRRGENPGTFEDFHDYGMSHFTERQREMFLSIMNEPDFFKKQRPYEGAREMIDELTEAGHEVVPASAMQPKLMGLRSEMLLREFPALSPRNIMLGARKDLLHVDFLLDDALHNINRSPAKYPVLFNRPWNMRAENYLRVETYSEFIDLVERVSLAPDEAGHQVRQAGRPGILCLVGPSASGKSFICDELVRNPMFRKICAITTREKRPGETEGEEYHFISEAEFKRHISSGELVEHTVYSGDRYGVAKKEIQDIWSEGRIAIKPMDIHGALACKQLYGDRCVSVFVRRNKEDIVASLLERNIPNEQKTKRLLSLDSELENESLCDWSINNNGTLDHAVQQILKIAS